MLKEGVEVLVSDAVMIALHCENIQLARNEYMAFFVTFHLSFLQD